MKALSLWQPWASAIALGFKKVETRHWYTSYRGPLVIHAAKKWDNGLRYQNETLIKFGLDLPEQPPLGVAICTCYLADIMEMTDELISQTSDQEQLLGNWAPGRFAWILQDVAPFNKPVPMKGRQGIWAPTFDELASLGESHD